MPTTFWGQSGMDPVLFDQLCDLAFIKKNMTRRINMRYKGKEIDRQIQVSIAEVGKECRPFIIFQLFFVEESFDRTLMGDH